MPDRYIAKPPADRSGLRAESDLPKALPYGLKPRDFLRVVEDVHEILHDVNSLLASKSYDRLDEMLDSAGFSGFVSRTVVDRLARASVSLVMNRQHNGFPDLLPRGVYRGDAVQHGTKGGLEVKSSRYEAGWQSHGPRAGWFCVVQFQIDIDQSKATKDREPTKVRAVMLAGLAAVDWSWQPAREGRIRSGTASVKPEGVVKLRRGAVWVDPEYEERHQELLRNALLTSFSAVAQDLVREAMSDIGEEVRVLDIAEHLAGDAGVDAQRLKGRINGAVRKLIAAGEVERVKPGVFRLRS